MNWTSFRTATLLMCCTALCACGGDDTTTDSGSPDGGCTVASCDDGLFCNGAESCDPTHAMADDRGCVMAMPACGSDLCDEDEDSCSRDCTNPDEDGDGIDAIACAGADCDDSNPDVFPGAAEICDVANVDEDCDPSTFGFRDADSDGVGDAACCNGETCGADCDDGNANVGTSLEACDGLDNDCDGDIDEGVLTTFYADTDGDDFGDPEGDTLAACSQPEDYSENDLDCNDRSAAVNPSAPDVCDGVGDNDCNPDTPNPFDTDDDGFDAFNRTSCPAANTDCDDENPDVNPDAVELCDGIDTNCDREEDIEFCLCARCIGACDDCTERDSDGECIGECRSRCYGECEECTGPTRLVESTPLEDLDGDGFLPIGATCEGGPLGDLPRTDCDDTSAQRFPGAEEICDGRDNDCDGRVDEGFPVIAVGDLPEDVAEVDDDGESVPADFSCVGDRSRPALGPSVTTDINVGFAVADIPLEFWDSMDVMTLDCMAPDCVMTTTDSRGIVSFTHRANQQLAVVGMSPAGISIGLVDPSADPNLEFTIDQALTLALDDCEGREVENATYVVYRDTPPGVASCGVTPSAGDGYPFVRRFYPHLSALGEMITVEAYVRLVEGGPLVLIARERTRVRDSAASFLRLPPLRADGPPAPE